MLTVCRELLTVPRQQFRPQDPKDLDFDSQMEHIPDDFFREEVKEVKAYDHKVQITTIIMPNTACHFYIKNAKNMGVTKNGVRD